jgi:hypothetical protein
MDEHADLTLDEYTHLPHALLKYKGKNLRNKCHFLRSYGCSVYEDRPLRCRLYPLGRILNKGKSYFIHISNCKCDGYRDGETWNVQEWIDASGAEDYLEYQMLVSGAFSYANGEKYRNLDKDIKLRFGKSLYNIDAFIEKNPGISHPITDKEIMCSLSLLVEKFLIEHGCLDRDYKNQKTVKPISIVRANKRENTESNTPKKPKEPVPALD